MEYGPVSNINIKFLRIIACADILTELFLSEETSKGSVIVILGF